LSPRMKHLVNDTTSAATRNFQFNQYGIWFLCDSLSFAHISLSSLLNSINFSSSAPVPKDIKPHGSIICVCQCVLTPSQYVLHVLGHKFYACHQPCQISCCIDGFPISNILFAVYFSQLSLLIE
jgi:hypothetical protein